MTFFNKKQEVLDIELTPYGELLLSEGVFKPEYYAFFDDNILYDSVTAYPLEERGKLYQTKDMNYGKMLEIRHKAPYLLKEYLNGNNSRSL